MKSFLLFFACASSMAGALMPLPAHMSTGQGALTIDSAFEIQITGHTDQRLRNGASRLLRTIAQQTGMPIVGGLKAVLTIDCRSASPEIPALHEDESYQLDITSSGALLKASTVTGALRGMQTFSQLIEPAADSFAIPATHIDDRPRFPWRGLMLDVGRHWMPLPVIERNIEAMAAVKLNVFHWHLSDDQGFRVESKLYPKLQQLGSDGNFYTQAEVKHIIAYAAERGIRVVPEFDIPGHTTSWLAAYPELASAPGPFSIERKWGIFDTALDPANEAVYRFLDGFLGEMAALFPDEYFHIGGDEVANTKVAAVQPAFDQKVQALLKKHGKKMIGWDEVLSPGLANDTVIQSWRGQASLADAAKKGYSGILSYGYYLDHMNPASFHYAIDPQGLGGEACMWTEYATDETVDSRIWPRAAAIAERFWSPANVTDVHSMYDRMERISRWLDWTGVQHRSGYGRMLDRLAGGNDTAALRTLADAVEALGIDDRQKARHYTSFVPLNRLADAARPESELVRHLENDIARRQNLAEVGFVFHEWASNAGRLRPTIDNNFLLHEIAPLSESLSKTGAIGLKGIQFLEDGAKPPADWLAESTQALDRMDQPQAEVRLAAVRAVRAVLEALGEAASNH